MVMKPNVDTQSVPTYNVDVEGRCEMPNITISMDEDLLKSGRRYAQKQNTSVNALIRKLLEQTVNPQYEEWMDECFSAMDRAGTDSKGKTWKREDLYDVSNFH